MEKLHLVSFCLPVTGASHPTPGLLDPPRRGTISGLRSQRRQQQQPHSPCQAAGSSALLPEASITPSARGGLSGRLIQNTAWIGSMVCPSIPFQKTDLPETRSRKRRSALQ